mmetsp:Transcript_8505/g.16053  ORF Transcript_8505/g.16053 Transcript_8505/m.16053 type:complete len:109 (+) Transcript_8505:627-953(+)
MTRTIITISIQDLTEQCGFIIHTRVVPNIDRTVSHVALPAWFWGTIMADLYMKEGDDTDVDNDFAEASLKDAWREAGICPPRMESPPPCAGGSCATASSAVELRVVGG